MKEQEFESNMEKLLRTDAENIEIDCEYKKALKNKIMGNVGQEKIVQIDKHRKNYVNTKKYLKIASSFVICAFLGINIYPVITSKGLNFNETKKAENVDRNNIEEDNMFEVKQITKLAAIDIDENNDSIPESSKEKPSANLDTKKESGLDSEAKALAKEAQLDEDVKIKGSNSIIGPKNILDEKKNIENKVKETMNINGAQYTKKENLVEDKTKEVLEEKKLPINGKGALDKNNNEQILEKKSDDNRITNDTNDDSINKYLLDDIKNKKNAAGLENEKKDELTPKIEEVSEKNNLSLNCYDSRNSKNGKSMVKAKKGKIYLVDVESGNEKSMDVDSDERFIAEKPNLLSDNTIIYCKKDSEGIGKPSIYRYEISTGEENVISEGSNPMVSKDGDKIAFELDGKILIKFLKSNTVETVDEGKYPSWSEDGENLSYVKEKLENSTHDSEGNKINKKYSTIWIYNSSTKKKNGITNKEFIANDDSSIQQWAEEVRGTQKGNQLELYGKYSYFESIWSNDNKSLFVIRKDNESNVFEFVKVDLK